MSLMETPSSLNRRDVHSQQVSLPVARICFSTGILTLGHRIMPRQSRHTSRSTGKRILALLEQQRESSQRCTSRRVTRAMSRALDPIPLTLLFKRSLPAKRLKDKPLMLGRLNRATHSRQHPFVASTLEWRLMPNSTGQVQVNMKTTTNLGNSSFLVALPTTFYCSKTIR